MKHASIEITIRGLRGVGKTYIARKITDMLIEDVGVSRVEYESNMVSSSTDAPPGAAKVPTIVRIVEVQRRS